MSKLLVYTRNPEEGVYPASLANSVHMAYSFDKKSFQPMNKNYGIVYPSATISQKNTINEKGLKNPYIFYTADGTFGIIAVRVGQNGKEDEESKGSVLLWTSKDLIHFNEHGLFELKKDTYVCEAVCEFIKSDGIYEIKWRDYNDNYYINTLTEINNTAIVSPLKEADSFVIEKVSTNLTDIIQGNIIDVDSKSIEQALLHWSQLYNTSIEIPDLIEVSLEEELKQIKALAVYNDGSKAPKKVLWDTLGIDFNKPGVYEIKGKAVQEHLKFPLAIGYADPDVIKWEGKYYFIATNDNTGDISLYVREADTVADLFKTGVKEHIILDVDKKRGFIQTFWAPEFHVIGGELYILFAVGPENWGPQSHMMRLKKGGSIINPNDWEEPIRVKKMDGSYLAEKGITLDMTYFEADNGSYLVWSYRKGIGTPDDTGSMLYIAEIDPKKPWILAGESVLLSRPLLGWENNSKTVNNEGPYTLITKDWIHLVYSGGAAGGYSYVLGMLSIKQTANLLNPMEWEKSCAPVLSYYSVEGEYGPGHNTFYTDDDGNVMIAYHAQEKMNNSPRCTGIRRVHFNIDGNPVFDMSIERDLNERFANFTAKVSIKK